MLTTAAPQLGWGPEDHAPVNCRATRFDAHTENYWTVPDAIFGLPPAVGMSTLRARSIMALSRGRQRGTRGQVVRTLGGEIGGSELARLTAPGGPPPKNVPPGVTGRKYDLTRNVMVPLIPSRSSRNDS